MYSLSFMLLLLGQLAQRGVTNTETLSRGEVIRRVLPGAMLNSVSVTFKRTWSQLTFKITRIHVPMNAADHFDILTWCIILIPRL